MIPSSGATEVTVDLEQMLVEVLEAVSGEPAMALADRDADGGDVDGRDTVDEPHAMARLAIRDGERHTLVEVWLLTSIARAMASWMLSVPNPSCEDVLDTVGELGNIIGGNVKTILGSSCRLSLPEARLVSHGRPQGQPETGTCYTALCEVLGQVVELVVRDDGDPSGLRWPGETEEAER